MEKRCYGCMDIKSGGPFCEHCGFDERTHNAVHQLPMGTVLKGQYIVGKVLGQGGFGITYIGYDQFLNTPVAIKEYYPNGFVTRDAAHSTFVTNCENANTNVVEANRQRFLREAQSLAKLSAIAEVVRVQNFFPENGTAYIVMEYIQGRTLKEYVKQYGALSADWVLRTLSHVMQALQRVHEAGIVHRDISPDNIMIMPDGRVKLLDFGAVRDYGVMVTQNTQAIVKPGFAPPEQYQTNGNIGPWTDVYAFCATLYYCMTGRLAPEAPKRMLENAHPEWNRIPGLTGQQIAALERGMALRYTERTQTIGELAGALFAPVHVSQNENKTHRSYSPQSQSQQSLVQQSQSAQGQISEEALERAREWKRQQEQKKEQVRLEQERAQRLADERAQREAMLRAQQAQRSEKQTPVWKKLIPIVGVALAVMIGLAILIPTGEGSDQPKAVSDHDYRSSNSGSADAPEVNDDETVPEATDEEDNPGVMDCSMQYVSDGKRYHGDDLEVIIHDDRWIEITVTGLDIRNSYQVNDPEETRMIHQYSWQVLLETSEACIGVSTYWANEPGQPVKSVALDQMDHTLLLRDESESDGIGVSYFHVDEIESVQWDSDSIRWRVLLPERYGAGAFPFDLDAVERFVVNVYDGKGDGGLNREYVVR